MVNNGGWLDEVLWVANTENDEDLAYLDEIIASDPERHKKLVIPGDKLWVYTYYKAWQNLERGKYYVKIDDDIVCTRKRLEGFGAWRSVLSFSRTLYIYRTN